MVSQPVVESADLATPPGAPMPGQCWIVAAGAIGDWAGQDAGIAGWTDNGWRFVMPGPGWRAWIIDRGNAVRYDGTDWTDEEVRSDGYFAGGERVLAGRQTAIANPTGGATVDSEVRATVTAILAALRAHGLIAT